MKNCHIIVRNNEENPIKASNGQWDINLKSYFLIPFENLPKSLIKKYNINISDIYKK